SQKQSTAIANLASWKAAHGDDKWKREAEPRAATGLFEEQADGDDASKHFSFSGLCSREEYHDTFVRLWNTRYEDFGSQVDRFVKMCQGQTDSSRNRPYFYCRMCADEHSRPHAFKMIEMMSHLTTKCARNNVAAAEVDAVNAAL